MKRTFRKAIACLLAVLMIVTAAPLSALARDQVGGQNVGWWGDSNFDATTNSTLYALVNDASGNPIEPEFETIVKEFEFGWADAYEVADTEVEDPEADLLDEMKPTITVTVTNMGNSVAGDFTTETGVTTTTRKYYYGETNKTLASMPATGVGSVLNPAELKQGQRITVTFGIGGIDANYATQLKGIVDTDYLVFGAYSATRKWATYTSGTNATPFVGNFYSYYGDSAAAYGSQICDCTAGQFYTPYASSTATPTSAYTGPEVRTVGEHGMLVCAIEFEVVQDCDLSQVMHLDQDKDNNPAWGCTEIVPYDETAAGGYFTFDTEDSLHTTGLIALNYTAYDAGSGPQPTTQYTVTFEDYAGNEVSSVAYDENTAAADVTVPANTASDAQYTYAWPTVADVTEDVTYRETRTVNEYPITFVNYAGDTVQSTNVAYGSTPTAPANTASDAQYTYAWPTVSAVTGAATYNETRSTNSYTITFVNAAGTTVSTQNLEYGATPVAPANTATDVGQAITTTYSWPAISAVTGDATYTEQSTSVPTQYTVTYTNYAGDVVSTQTLDYGATPVAPANTASDAQYTYAWPTVSDVTGDANYDETRTVNQYTVTWDFADDRQNQTDTYEYGATLVAPQNSSVKVGNVTTTYKWEGVADVTGDVTYTEVVDQQITDAFTVTFKTYDGTEYTQSYAAGTEASVLAADAAAYSTASDAQYTYAWPAFADVTADATYTETRTVNTYTLTFVKAGGAETTQTYAYGTTEADIYPPENTADTQQYTYTWPEIATVTADATYNEVETLKQYTVTFNYYDGTYDQFADVDYGTTINVPANKTETSGYTTTYYKWDPAVGATVTVEDDVVYSEVVDYTETTQFTVTFVNAAGTTVSEAQYDGGTAAADVTVPANTANTKRTTYAWPAVADVTENVTYNEVVTDLGYTVAVTPSTLGSATIDGENVASKNVPLNTNVTLVATPAEGATFVCWQAGGVSVSTNATYTTAVVADVEYTPVFSEAASQFTVVFVDKFGNVVDAQTVDSGADVVVPTAPALSGYTAATDNGWDKTNDEIAALKEAATITAVYTADEVTTYTVTADGATITYKGEATENELSGLPYDAKVTLSADNAAVWKVDGVAVAYGETYTFFVGASVTVTFETAAVVAAPTITGISVSKIGSEGAYQGAFLAAFSLGNNNATFVKAGYIYGKGVDPETTLDDVDGTNVKASYVKATPTQYQLNYGYRAQTGVITAIAFLVYKDATGNHTIYATPQTFDYANMPA